MMIPAVQITAKVPSSFVLTAFFSIIIDGRDSVVTPFMKERTTPSTLPDYKLYYKAIITKTIWYCHKTRHIDQWNRIKKPETNQCTYVQLIFNKGAKNTQWRKDSLFSKCAHWIFIYKRMKLDSYLTPLTKISTQWIKVLNKRIETTKR